MTFNLDQQEAAAIINVLGQLPTNSGIYPVLVKMVDQYKAQEQTTAAE